MKHVAMIIAHENPNQIEVLTRVFVDSGWFVVIHIDAIMPENEYLSLCQSLSSDSVKFIERKHISWGSYLLVETELRLLKAAISWEADYYHLFSGADLPIKPTPAFEEFITRHSGTEFVHIIPDWAKSIGIKNRFSLYHLLQNKVGRSKGILWVVNRILLQMQRVIKVDRTKHNATVEFFGGMQWFSITHAFASYVLDNQKWISSTFSHGLCVDEIFLQTLLMNSPFAQNRYIPEDTKAMSGSLRLVDWVRGKPYTWQHADFNELINNDNFIARKFSYKTEDEKALTHRIIDRNNNRNC